MVGLLICLQTKLQCSTAVWPLKRGRYFKQPWPLATLAWWHLVRCSLYYKMLVQSKYGCIIRVAVALRGRIRRGLINKLKKNHNEPICGSEGEV